MIKITSRSLCAIAVSAMFWCGGDTAVAAGEPVGPKLTPRLAELLADEMQQVAQATADLVVAIASGDHEAAASLGAGIRDSFILKQSLTDQDKHDLMAAVPPAFIALDQHFHGTAGKLVEAAHAGDSELQGFYYSRMIEACVQCHGNYAADRFPGLGEPSAPSHEH